MPNALAFSPDGERLYVCNGAQNAVAVMDWEPNERGGTKLLGLIPVGWHPGAVVVDPARQRLAVANIKGLPVKPKPRGASAGFNSHHYHGSVSILPIPGDDDLPPLSERVARNMRAGAIRDALAPDCAEILVQGDGTPLRSYLHADDLVQWLLTILHRGTPAHAYNVGSDQAISIADLAHLVRDLLASGKTVRITREALDAAGRSRYVPSIARARSELGLDVRIQLPDAIRLTAAALNRSR
jgi:hypothetical protein